MSDPPSLQARLLSRSGKSFCARPDLDHSNLYQSYYNILACESKGDPASMAEGLLDVELGCIRLTKPHGKFFHTMGFSKNGYNYLYPEEAVYLACSGLLRIISKGLPLSLQQLQDAVFDYDTYSSTDFSPDELDCLPSYGDHYGTIGSAPLVCPKFCVTTHTSLDILYLGYDLRVRGTKRVHGFSKSTLPSPDFLVIILRPDYPYPEITYQAVSAAGVSSTTAILVAMLDNDDISFHWTKPFTIPVISRLSVI
ncbi:unnamed protein product, partial [Protopolystoma xenopodis]